MLTLNVLILLALVSDTSIDTFSNVILSPVFGRTPNLDINSPPKVSASMESGSILRLKKLINSSSSILASTLKLLSRQVFSNICFT